MVASINQIQNGISHFIENEIANKAVGVKKFGVYFMLPMVDKYVVLYSNKLRSILPDMFDENGNVKIDDIYGNAKTAIQKSGQFEFVGIIFNENDVDKLYSYIKSTSIGV